MSIKNNEIGDNEWRVSSPRTLFTNPVVNLLSSRVHCGRTGIEKDFYKFEFPSWVNVVAVSPNKEILIIHQYRFGTGRVEVEIPGGAVEEKEPPLEAGQRELLEETGYRGDNARIIGKVCPNPAIQNNFCYTVLVENAKKIGEPDLDDMEDIEVLTIPVEDVLNMISDGTIEHGLVLNALMFYALATKQAFW